MLDRFGNDFWTSFQRVEYDADFSVEQPYDEFCKAFSYSYQNEFRIALDLAKGKFNPEQLKDVTDFARLTFPVHGKSKPRKSRQNTANRGILGGSFIMIKILFVCRGRILKNPEKA